MEDWWLGAVAFLLLLLLLSPSENSVLLRFLPAPSPRSIAGGGPGLGPRDGLGGA
ncbi:hypothetical protein BDA96_04G369300 [Sorghum bicolor]|uniref:Uncharacterized protein n=1 Tax=Sorghum bicolor TaxID=4558 RepID=A0A921R8R3_SORBI|nr:hypothetical protein BDA96_04G369300 [Sorghum bicolor]